MWKFPLPIGLNLLYQKIMSTQELSETKKTRGRPRGSVKPATAVLRVEESTLKTIDDWAAKRPDPKPTRPEAIRQLVEVALRAERTNG